MKIYILKNKLKEGLNIVERVASKSLTLPILNNVLLAAEKNFLKLSVTDLEIGINYWNLAQVEQEGKIATPAKFLSNFVNSIPDEKVTIRTHDKVLYIEGKGYKTKINSFDSEEFPIIPKIKEDTFIEIDSASFCQGLSQVVDNVSSTQVRPEISGVYLSFQKDLLVMAATDSFRLAEKKLFFENKNNKEHSVIVPQKAARELINILSDRKGKVKAYFSPGQIMFEYPMEDVSHPQFQIVSRLIEGEYPNYREIIPKECGTKITISRNEFVNQIKTASLFSGRVNKIQFSVDAKGGKIEVSAQDPELGENNSIINGKIEGEDIVSSFNWRFLMDGLINIKSEEVSFELNKDEGPAILKPVGDQNFLYVVMPIKGD